MPDPDLPEQFPLSPADDFMIHQTPEPIRVMWSSDHRTYERFWTVFHDDAGELIVATGLSFYPNLDTAEAYAIVNHRGRHRSVRAFRRLGADRMDLRMGPIHPTIVEGLREWRYELDDNDWGISFDVTFRDTIRGMFRERKATPARSFPPGRQPDVTSGFESFGVVEGWVKAGDERITLSADSCRGTRDRHWGVGRNVGGPKLELPRPRTTVGHSGNSFVAFSDYAIWGDSILYPFGDARPGMGRIVQTDRRLRFEPDTHIFVEGEIDYTLDDGDVKRVHYERIGAQTAYLRCAMYGGTPDSGIHQGEYVGDDVVEGDDYDVNDPQSRMHLMGLDEHQCRVTCDGETVVGIYQPIDPDAYERYAAGLPVELPVTDALDADTAARYRDGLRRWLGSRVAGAEVEVEVGELEPISSVGNARRPWMFDVRWREGGDARAVRCVMLVKVPDGQLETELGPEYSALQVLNAHGVPTPRPLWIDPDGSALGEPFFVTEWVPGTASLELLQRPAGDPQSRAVAEGMADVAAGAHTVDWEAAGVSFLPRVSRESAAHAQVDEWEEKFVRQRMEPLPAVVYAFDWLREHAPVADRVSIVHGDFRFGNVLYDGPRVTAMLDWEMVHLGDPLEDLAWAYRTRWGLARFMPIEDFLARYSAASGMVVEREHFRWYRMFVEVKHTVISITAGRSFNDGRTTWLRHADRASMAAPFMSRFFDLLNEPADAPAEVPAQ